MVDKKKQLSEEELNRVMDENFSKVVDEALSLEVQILEARDGIMEHVGDLNKYHIAAADKLQIEQKPESADQTRQRVMQVVKRGGDKSLDGILNQAYQDKKKHREKKRKKKAEEEKKETEIVTVSIRPSPVHIHYS